MAENEDAWGKGVKKRPLKSSRAGRLVVVVSLVEWKGG
jgi:hypothetical protein